MDFGFDAFVPSEDGRWVSEHFERLARVIQDYDPQFELRWIPPEFRETREEKSNPYVVWDTVANCPCLFASELDTPEGILARLFDADNKHGDVLTRLEAHNAAVQALELKKKMDEDEERQERVAFLMGTKKNYINLGNGRIVDDQLRPIR
jgi:hypothetical protein